MRGSHRRRAITGCEGGVLTGEPGGFALGHDQNAKRIGPRAAPPCLREMADWS